MSENEKIIFKCPECGKKLSVDEQHSDKKSRCPSCGKRIHIPKKSKN